MNFQIFCCILHAELKRGVQIFKPNLVDHNFAGIAPVQTVDTGDAAELIKSGYFPGHCQERGIREWFITTNIRQFNAVTEKWAYDGRVNREGSFNLRETYYVLWYGHSVE